MTDCLSDSEPQRRTYRIHDLSSWTRDLEKRDLSRGRHPGPIRRGARQFREREGSRSRLACSPLPWSLVRCFPKYCTYGGQAASPIL